MSRALEGIYRALAPLRLYRLEENSLIDRELAAYEAAFAPVEKRMEEAGRQGAVQTASGEALARHERLVGLTPRLTLEEKTRRELVLYRMGAAPFDFSREGMLSSIRAAGMEAEIREDPAGEEIAVRCLGVIDATLDLDSLKAGVRTVLPAHLPAEFDFGELTWEMLEETGITWDDWDGADMTWTEFDLNGIGINK